MDSKIFRYSLALFLLFFLVNGCTPSKFAQYQEEIERDPSFCTKTFTGENRDWCYAFAANIKQDPQFCLSITSESIYKECLDEVASEITDPEKCKALKTDFQKDNCYINVAVYTKDISYCDQTTSQEAKYGCEGSFGRATLNESLCQDSSCIGFVAAYKNTPALCRTIGMRDLKVEATDYNGYSVSNTIDSCFAFVAKVTKNAVVCSEIKDQFIADTCYMDLARQNKDITLCKHVSIPEGQPNEYKFGNCYQYIALEQPMECLKVGDDSLELQNTCFYGVSYEKEDPSFCKYIVLPNDKDVTCDDYLDSLGVVAVPRR